MCKHISRLPPVLTFCLNRIELDYNTLKRKKINEKFDFPSNWTSVSLLTKIQTHPFLANLRAVLEHLRAKVNSD
jgi:hypothetical protein